jgi:acyl-CoA reductase-like NAD-dependent aldehyde dehydrogenase
MKAAAMSNVKDIALELGGKSPLVVFADADLNRAADLAVASITISTDMVYALLVKFLANKDRLRADLYGIFTPLRPERGGIEIP